MFASRPSRGMRASRPSLLFIWLLGLTSFAPASETPAPPNSALSGLVRKLADKRAAERRPITPPAKEDLLKPEFRFRRAATWLQLPEIARQLTTNDAERTAILELLVVGTTEASRLLAAEGADHDVAAATALYITQLWSFVHQKEIPEPGADHVHAQIVSVLAGPEMAKLSDAEKQRYWEYCIGFPIFVLGMREVATEPSAQADLRTIAAAGFKLLVGVDPTHIEIGANGLELSASAQAILAQPDTPTPTTVIRAPQQSAPAPATSPSRGPAASGDPTATAKGVSGITFTPPAGWSREDSGGTSIFRNVLGDVDEQGQPKPYNTGQHGAVILVLPRRPVTGDVQATFEATWREQFESFELGDTIAHYRARLNSGLVIHFMGRFLERKARQERDLRAYASLILVNLGAGYVQPIAAIVYPKDTSPFSMGRFVETDAYRALFRPMTAMLESIQPVGGPAPYPAGGLFAPHHLHGEWSEASNTYGGSYVNAVTGASVGSAMTAGSTTLRLGADGTYNYSVGYHATSPITGSSSGYAKHEGRYRLNGDIVLAEPTKPTTTPLSACAVGIGVRQTPNGPRRLLITVAQQDDGRYLSPPWVANWDGYNGRITWYVEK